jgi:hypothetical protein
MLEDKLLRGAGNRRLQLLNKWRDNLVRIVRFIRRRQRLYREVPAVSGGPNDTKKAIEIEPDIASRSESALFNLPVDGVGCGFLHVNIGIRRPEIAGIDDGSAPRRVDQQAG